MFNGHFWPLKVISGQVVLIWINYILNNIWVMVTYLFCYSEIANTLKHSSLVSLRKARIFFLSQSICEPLLQASPLRRRPIWTVNNSWSTPTHSCQLCNVTILLLEQLQLTYTLFWIKRQLSSFLFQKYSGYYFGQSRITLKTSNIMCFIEQGVLQFEEERSSSGDYPAWASHGSARESALSQQTYEQKLQLNLKGKPQKNWL